MVEKFALCGDWWSKPRTVRTLQELSHAHDFIIHSIVTAKFKVAEFSQFYASGLSLRDISDRTGTSKTKVRSELIRGEVALRVGNKRQKFELGKTKHKQCGTIPFGYAYLEGQLVVDPKEYKIVLDMCRRWKVGESYRSIAKHLNDQKISMSRGNRWHHEVVKQIIQRHQPALY